MAYTRAYLNIIEDTLSQLKVEVPDLDNETYTWFKDHIEEVRVDVGFQEMGTEAALQDLKYQYINAHSDPEL